MYVYKCIISARTFFVIESSTNALDFPIHNLLTFLHILNLLLLTSSPPTSLHFNVLF